jgi:hypothetical protein
MSSQLSQNCPTCDADYSSCSCEEEIRQEMEEFVYDTLHELVEKTLGPNGLTIDDKLFWENEDIDTSMELAISTITNCLTKYKHKGKPSTYSGKNDQDYDHNSVNESETIKPISLKGNTSQNTSTPSTITMYRLIRREYNMADPVEEGNVHETIHSSKQELLSEIKDSGRLAWWFELYIKDDPDELEKEQEKKFGISWENPYEIFDKPFPLFWKFYETVIGKNTVHYEIIEEKHEKQETIHHQITQTNFSISHIDYENTKYLNGSKTTFINDCGITIIYCTNHPCTNHIYVDDDQLFSKSSLSCLIPSSHLEDTSSYESWPIPDNVSLESIQCNMELICPDCYTLSTKQKNPKDNNEDEEISLCVSCNIPLDYYRDGTIENGYRCHNCYWEEEEKQALRENIKLIIPDYRINK